MIGHIAANHSTWDLELENLSVESLLLIYADFRVKSGRDAGGRELVYFILWKNLFRSSSINLTMWMRPRSTVIAVCTTSSRISRTMS